MQSLGAKLMEKLLRNNKKVSWPIVVMAVALASILLFLIMTVF